MQGSDMLDHFSMCPSRDWILVREQDLSEYLADNRIKTRV